MRDIYFDGGVDVNKNRSPEENGLRDYFAGKALKEYIRGEFAEVAGMAASGKGTYEYEFSTAKEIAEYAYDMADAMLRERDL